MFILSPGVGMENNKENKVLEGPKEQQGNGQQGEQPEPQGRREEQSSVPQEAEEDLGIPGEDEERPPEEHEHWEADLDYYPLREPSEDARWAVRTVKIWVGFALCAMAFILTLLILGTIYD